MHGTKAILKVNKEKNLKIMNKKILIIGASGQLGSDLIRELGTNFQIIRMNHQQLDVTSQKQCAEVILMHKPNVILNTAAFHKTEECEINPRKSFEVNAVGAYNVAAAAQKIKATVFYISTNYVFSGGKQVYFEYDQPSPINVYGASKLSGEFLTQIGTERNYIIRTAGLFGRYPSSKGYNFITLMVRKAKQNKHIKVVNDEYTSLTYTQDLASKINEFIYKLPPFGIYHIVNQGGPTWFEVATRAFELMNIKTTIKPIHSLQRNGMAKRPLHAVLGSRKLRAAGIQPLRKWGDALRDYIGELRLHEQYEIS